MYTRPVSGRKGGTGGSERQNELPQDTRWNRVPRGNAVCSGNRQAPRRKRGMVFRSGGVHGLWLEPPQIPSLSGHGFGRTLRN